MQTANPAQLFGRLLAEEGLWREEGEPPSEQWFSMERASHSPQGS